MMKSVLLVLVILHISTGYDVRCPGPSEWKHRAANYCTDSTDYICLYNEHDLVYSASCDEEYKSRLGRKRVRSPGINEIDCSPTRYQPFIFTTNGNSDCVYGKSLCTEEGQVVASNGTTTEDIGCRCDYTKGYTYTTAPENVYSCIPSKEDCSCYLKQCTSDTILTADYICVEKSRVSYPAIITSPINGIGMSTSSAEWFTNNISKTRTSAQDAVVGIIVIVLIYVVLLLVLFVEVQPYLIRTDIQYREDLIVDKCDESLKYTLIPGGDLKIEWEVESRFPVKWIVVQKERANMQSNNKYIWKLSKDRRKQSLTIESDDPGTTNVVQKYGENIQFNTKYKWKPSIDRRTMSLTNESDDAETSIATYQKDGENIQLDKYIWKPSKDGRKLSLTIKQIELDDAGTYTCIFTNVLGLSNDYVDRCVNWLFKVETALDFRKCLTHFPICRLAVINPFQANVIDLTTEIVDIVLTKDENMKLEVNCSHYITILKWFKCVNNNLTALPLKDRPDKYSGGTNTEPSLRINSSQMDDAGEYVCVLMCANNNILTFVFYLQEKSYKEIRCHREDKFYVKTSTVDKAYQCLSTHGMVVLSGRKGTGKTKMCLELVSLCENADFQHFRVELSECGMEKLNTEKLLYIIDNVRFEAQNHDKLKKIMSLLSYTKHQWIVITCRSENMANLKDVLKDSDMFEEESVMDLNDSLTVEDKTLILRTYFKANNISQTLLQDSNYRSKDILSGNVPVKIDRETTDKIIKSNPYYGYPLAVVQFCEDRKRLHLGYRYFTNPPKLILEKIKEIYQKGRDGNEDSIHQYCILVHIATQGHLNVDDFIVPSYKITAKELFDKEFGSDIMKDIQNAADSMCGQFVECQAKKYKFIHSCTAKVVFMSSDYCALHYLIISGFFQDIKDCVRSYKYKPVEDELVYKLTCDQESMYPELCDRLILENIELSKEIYLYMYTEFIQLHDTTFLNVLIKKLDQLKAKGVISMWQIITVLDAMTNYGIDPWIYLNKDSNETFQKYPYVQCGLIAACKSEYLIGGAENVWTSLISIFEKCLKDQAFVDSLGKSLDINGNTFFHYLTLFSKAESFQILGIEECLSKENRGIFGKPNKLFIRPIEMAAFMGKFSVFKLIYVKTSKKLLGLAVRKEGVNEMKNKCLNTIARNGMNYYFGSGKSSSELDITVNFESDVLSSATCGSKEDYLAIIEFLQQKEKKIKKFVASQRKA